MQNGSPFRLDPMGVLLLDVRSHERYAAGHLPGAVRLDPERDLTGETDDASHGGRHPLPDTAALAATFGRAGVDAELDRNARNPAVTRGASSSAGCGGFHRKRFIVKRIC